MSEMICYQAPESCQWVRQSKKLLEISKDVPVATSPMKITSIWPSVVNLNVMTSLSFNGAAKGDRAVFINSLERTDCEGLRPDREAPWLFKSLTDLNEMKMIKR